MLAYRAVMTVAELLHEKRDEILAIAEKHGVRHVRVFGSAARGDASEGSDIDLLVDVGEQASPWFPTALIEELEQVLGRPVDVVTEDGLYWLLKRRILEEARPL